MKIPAIPKWLHREIDILWWALLGTIILRATSAINGHDVPDWGYTAVISSVICASRTKK